MLDGEFTFVCDGKKMVIGTGGYILPWNSVRYSMSFPSSVQNADLGDAGHRVRWNDERDGSAGDGEGGAFTDRTKF